MIDLIKELKGAKKVGISGHIRPDGDSIGAAMGMYLYLKNCLSDIELHVFLEDIPVIYKLIRGSENIESGEGREDEFDAFLVLDCAIDRTGPIEACVRKSKKVINIDHHVSNRNGSGDVNYCVPKASSASEVCYELMNKDYVDIHVAEAIYIGIVNDTGVFQYSCTSKRTMEIAGELINYGFDFSSLIEKTFYEKTYIQNQILGRALLESILFMDGRCIVSCVDRKTMDFYAAKPKHLDGIVSQLRNTRGVDCAIFLYETEFQNYKVSLRSNEKVDVSKIAELFGGGGHKRAAGCTMNGTYHDIINNLSGYIEEQLKEKK